MICELVTKLAQEEPILRFEKDKTYSREDAQILARTEGLPETITGLELYRYMRAHGWMTTFETAHHCGRDRKTITRNITKYPSFIRRFSHSEREDTLVHNSIFEHYKPPSRIHRHRDLDEIADKIDPEKDYNLHSLGRATGISHVFFLQLTRKGELPHRKEKKSYLIRGKDAQTYLRAREKKLKSYVTLNNAVILLHTTREKLIEIINRRVFFPETREINGRTRFVVHREELPKISEFLMPCRKRGNIYNRISEPGVYIKPKIGYDPGEGLDEWYLRAARHTFANPNRDKTIFYQWHRDLPLEAE